MKIRKVLTAGLAGLAMAALGSCAEDGEAKLLFRHGLRARECE